VWAAAGRAALAAALDAEELGSLTELPPHVPADPGPSGAEETLALLKGKGARRIAAAAASLAAGAAEGLERVLETARPGDVRETRPALLRETRFAREVLSACRTLLARSGQEAPPPATGLKMALFRAGPPRNSPETSPPDALRAELADLAPGSREALAAGSRLGGALADEAAWRRARAPSFAADGPRDTAREAGTLLRSASAYLDALLGRDHPDSLDARERLARFLSGDSGPGLPFFPLPDDLPPADDLRAALAMYIETAVFRAAASAGRGAGPASADAARARAWAADPRVSRKDPLAPTPSLETLELLESNGDEASLGAMLRAFETGMLMHLPTVLLPQGCAYMTLTARMRLEDDHPVSLRFMAASACYSLAKIHSADKPPDRQDLEKAMEDLNSAVCKMQNVLGPSSPEAARALATLAMAHHANGYGTAALVRLAETLDVLENMEGAYAPSPEGPARTGLPPGRAGTERLAARALIAERLIGGGYHGLALGALAPLLEALPDLPSGGGQPGAWPWPPALTGRALCHAGEAAEKLDDHALAEKAFRAAVRAMDDQFSLDAKAGRDRDPSGTENIHRALSRLSQILVSRGVPEGCRDAAGLLERDSEFLSALKGPDSPETLSALAGAARCRELAGDRETALALHRKVLEARSRVLGPYAKPARESRAEVRRLEREIRGD
jgi:hypothetical protein